VQENTEVWNALMTFVYRRIMKELYVAIIGNSRFSYLYLSPDLFLNQFGSQWVCDNGPVSKSTEPPKVSPFREGQLALHLKNHHSSDFVLIFGEGQRPDRSLFVADIPHV
jgi:hypothetical protein